MGERLAAAVAALDVQTGGGEVLATASRPPPLLVATESWPPNVSIARRNLVPLGGRVVQVGDGSDFPFRDRTFDLVVSRHPTTTRWDEIARVLRRGGTYLSQDVAAGSMREVTDAVMGPQPVSPVRDPRRAASRAEAAGLTVVDLRQESLRAEFFDIAAVVHFLRKVPWIVPGFAVDRYRQALAQLHARITADGSFVATSERFLIEARRGG
jgi:SAM-dependent methyltransferase